MGFRNLRCFNFAMLAKCHDPTSLSRCGHDTCRWREATRPRNDALEASKVAKMRPRRNKVRVPTDMMATGERARIFPSLFKGVLIGVGSPPPLHPTGWWAGVVQVSYSLAREVPRWAGGVANGMARCLFGWISPETVRGRGHVSRHVPESWGSTLVPSRPTDSTT